MAAVLRVAATGSMATTQATTRTTMRFILLLWLASFQWLLLMGCSTTFGGGGVAAFVAPLQNQPRKAVSENCHVVVLHRLRLLMASSPSSTTTTSSVSSTPSSTISTTTATTPEQRAVKAKETWSTIALQQQKHPSTTTSSNNKSSNKNIKNGNINNVGFQEVVISLSSSNISTIYHHPNLFEEFVTTIHGTYYINGLGSCQVGNQLLHPFESHGIIKSLIFNGKGQLIFKTRLIETELNRNEVEQNQILARGVMSTSYNPHTLVGAIRNAFSPTERDTANLVAYLWPLPDNNNNNNNQDTMDPLLITCTDNGEPHVLDPLTLEMKGKLVNVIPKLQSALDNIDRDSNKPRKFLAHTRYDQSRKRLIMCTNQMDIPGVPVDVNDDDGTTKTKTAPHFQGNSTYEFIEFDSNWNVVSSRNVTTRFMVAHDWIITDNYYVLPQNPAKLVWPKVFQFLLGITVGTDIFEMDHDTYGAFLLIPRHNSKEPIHRIESNAFFNLFHFGPCYEEEVEEKEVTTKGDSKNDDSITNKRCTTIRKKEMIIHGAVFDSYKFGGEMGFDGQTQQFDPIGWATQTINPNSDNDDDRLCAPAPRLDKFVLDLNTLTLKERRRLPIIDDSTTGDNDDGDDIPVDMPQYNKHANGDGRKCRYSYFLGASRPEGWFPFRSVVKMDLETGKSWNWDAGDGQVVSEPMFIPRPFPNSNGGKVGGTTHQQEEDDGFVLSIVHDAENRTCRLLIWDSQRFSEGPIAESKLGDLMPWCVHGSWYPGYNP